jgi:hypothetical protein
MENVISMKPDASKSTVNVLRTLLSVFLHLLIGTVGVGFLSNIGTFFLFKLAHSFYPSVTIQQLHWTLTGIPGFPVQAIIGLFVGFVLAKYMRRTIMVWTWLLPMAFLCVRILFFVRDNSSVWDHFFGYGCSVNGHCFDQVALTLPLIASTAYSIGAKLRGAASGSPK